MLLDSEQQRIVSRSIEQLHADAQLEAPLDKVNALLRHQLHALLTRLSILHGRQQAQAPVISPSWQRFQRFQQLVEERFAQWHQVADYASRLACTEKSLTRAVTAAMGNPAAKQFANSATAMEDAYLANRERSPARRALIYTLLREGNHATALSMLMSLR